MNLLVGMIKRAIRSRYHQSVMLKVKQFKPMWKEFPTQIEISNPHRRIKNVQQKSFQENILKRESKRTGLI